MSYKECVLNKGHIYIFTGCISAEELQFVMNHLPGKVREIKILIFIGPRSPGPIYVSGCLSLTK